MAKKQRGQRTSPESSVTAGYQCATSATDSTIAENFLEKLFYSQASAQDQRTGLAAFTHDSIGCSFELSDDMFPLGPSTTEWMHKQKTTTAPERDNLGQQPEATVSDILPVASSPSFPDSWFEKPYFANPASSNASNSTLATSSYGVGSRTQDDIHQMVRGADGTRGDGCGLDGRNERQIALSPPPSSSGHAARSLWVDNSLQSTTSWRAETEILSPSTSSTYHSFESSNKRRKKRPSGGASFDVSSDSDDSDDDDGSLSDVEENEGAIRESSQQFSAKFLELRSNGKPCNFWQYNSQARGPKGRRIYGEITLKDCHVLDEFSDPVTTTHGGSGKGQPNKLRHGEGNDPRPDADKLMEIGSRIGRLEEEFRRLNAAAKSGNKDEVGRQKNKLASRICRLKKKAQHEANKVKLEGLREEHEQLVAVVARLVMIMETHILTRGAAGTTSLVTLRPSFCSQLESLIQSHLKFMIAGHTAEYVNMQLQKSAERLQPKSRSPV